MTDDPSTLEYFEYVESVLEPKVAVIASGTSVDRFEDPGEYPSNAGSSPLPNGNWYLEDYPEEETFSISWEDSGMYLKLEDLVDLEDLAGSATAAGGFALSWTVKDVAVGPKGVDITLKFEAEEGDPY